MNEPTATESPITEKSAAEIAAGNKIVGPRPIQWWLYLLLLAAAGTQLLRILTVISKDEKTPFLSANDRSRWCTIEALASDGTYAIDELIFADPEQKRRTPWATIDLVRHRGQDGRQHYYSSKPTLLPTLYSGVYAAARALTGWNLREDTFRAGRLVLVLVNLLPVVLFWLFVIRWFLYQTEATNDRRAGEGDVEEPPTDLQTRFANSSWSLVVLTILLGWGTFLSTFTNTLNNHIPAAIAVGVSLYCLERIAVRRDEHWAWFVLCGLATSFGAANELPALSWVAAAGAILLVCDFKKTFLAYAPALLPVALGFFGTNYLAHGTFAPAYAHRDAGKLLCEVEKFSVTEELIQALAGEGVEVSSLATVSPARRPDTFRLFDPVDDRNYALKVKEDSIAVHEWGDWYDYPRSYWAGNQQGVDKGEPDQTKYAFHCLVGHHGVFSLTPFWLILPLALVPIINQGGGWNLFRNRQLLIAAAVLATSVVVLGFYLARGQEDRNYGGVTSGLRWAFWLIPFWLWLSMFALRTVRIGWARRLVELLVLVSIVFASLPWKNPWTTPWLMEHWPSWFPY